VGEAGLIRTPMPILPHLGEGIEPSFMGYISGPTGHFSPGVHVELPPDVRCFRAQILRRATLGIPQVRQAAKRVGESVTECGDADAADAP
jgi:hypothetical protein